MPRSVALTFQKKKQKKIAIAPTRLSFAWRVVRRARATSEAHLREARLPPVEVERVLDMLERSDVENYELVVAVLRERVPAMLHEAARPVVH